MKIPVNPEVLAWAAEQSGEPMEKLEKAFPALSSWICGKRQPTILQLESFAKKTRVPFGYLLLQEVPVIHRPEVHDFRTLGSRPIPSYSRNLLDTIQQMKNRQEWLREYKKTEGYAEVAFVGSLTKRTEATAFLQRMHDVLGTREGWQQDVRSKEEAFQYLRSRVEAAGVIVFVNGIVGNDTHRPLQLEEFRGFALADAFAPLIFINGADALAGRLFTMVHELVHLFLGQDGLDDGTEKFCNEMAAGFLVPEALFASLWESSGQDFEELEKTFYVSRPALYRVALTRHYISKGQYEARLRSYEEEMRHAKQRGGGGSFYKILPNRIGRSFSRYVFSAVQEGKLLYRDAYRLLGIHGNSFQQVMKETAGA